MTTSYEKTLIRRGREIFKREGWICLTPTPCIFCKIVLMQGWLQGIRVSMPKRETIEALIMCRFHMKIQHQKIRQCPHKQTTKLTKYLK